MTSYVAPKPSPVQVEPVSRPVSVSAIESKSPNRTSQKVARVYAQAEERPSKPRSEPAIVVGQVMTSPVVRISVTTKASVARQLLIEHRFRHLPVTDDSGALVGLVSDRDLLAIETTEPNRPIHHIMIRNLLIASFETPLRLAVSAMLEKRIGALPVIHSGHNLVGIVTTTDILRCIVRDAPIDLWA